MRQHYRSISRILLGMSATVLMLACLLYTVWVVTDPNTLAIKQVVVEGSLEHLDKSELQSLVLPYVTGGFFHIDVVKVQEVLTDLAWVESVSVQRIWPDSLRITVIEHLPIARWGTNKLVNSKGDVFQATKLMRAEDLPQFNGPLNKSRQMVKQFKKFRYLLEKVGLKVKQLSLSQRQAWDLELDNGMLLRLGREDALGRIERFIKSYGLIAGEKLPKYADLRYTNGVAVSW